MATEWEWAMHRSFLTYVATVVQVQVNDAGTSADQESRHSLDAARS